MDRDEKIGMLPEFSDELETLGNLVEDASTVDVATAAESKRLREIADELRAMGDAVQVRITDLEG